MGTARKRFRWPISGPGNGFKIETVAREPLYHERKIEYAASLRNRLKIGQEIRFRNTIQILGRRRIRFLI